MEQLFVGCFVESKIEYKTLKRRLHETRLYLSVSWQQLIYYHNLTCDVWYGATS